MQERKSSGAGGGVATGSRRGATWAALLLFVSGCGESPPQSKPDEGTPSPGETVPSAEVAAAIASRSPAELDQPTWFYRVDLVRDAGGVVGVRAVTAVESSVRPTPGFGGTHWAVGYAGAEVASAVPVLFPSEGRGTFVSADGQNGSVRFRLEASSVSAFVPATGVDRVTITNLAGVDVVDIPRESLPALGRAQKTRSGSLGTERQALEVAALRTRYPHVQFLSAGDEAKLPPWWNTSTIIATTDLMNTVIDTALGKLTPSVLAAVQQVSVVH